MVGVFIFSVSEYEKNFNLMLEYINGSGEAGDEIAGRTAFDVAFRLAFKGVSHMISGQTQRLATKLLSKYVDEGTAAVIAGNSDELYDTVRYIRKLEKNGVSSSIISKSLETLGAGELGKLVKIAAGGFGDDVLEKILLNKGVLSTVSAGSIIRVLKGTANNADDVIKLFSRYGEHVNDFFLLYGDDVLGFMIAHGDDGYKIISTYGHDAMIVVNELKDAAFDFIKNYADDGIRFIVTYGDEGYKLFTAYGDDVIRIAAAYGDDGIKLITEHGKSAIDIINDSGETGVQALIKHGSKYIEYTGKYSDFAGAYAKYGDAAFEAFDKYGDDALKYLESGSPSPKGLIGHDFEDYLTQKYKRGPTDIELSSFLEIPIYKLVEVRNCYQTLSLDDDSNESNLYDYISLDDTSKDDLILLRDALNRLEAKEKELIIKRYFYNKTQQEIANELGINQVKISREEGKVLTKLKKYM